MYIVFKTEMDGILYERKLLPVMDRLTVPAINQRDLITPLAVRWTYPVDGIMVDIGEHIEANVCVALFWKGFFHLKKRLIRPRTFAIAYSWQNMRPPFHKIDRVYAYYIRFSDKSNMARKDNSYDEMQEIVHTINSGNLAALLMMTFCVGFQATAADIGSGERGCFQRSDRGFKLYICRLP